MFGETQPAWVVYSSARNGGKILNVSQFQSVLIFVNNNMVAYVSLKGSDDIWQHCQLLHNASFISSPDTGSDQRVRGQGDKQNEAAGVKKVVIRMYSCRQQQHHSLGLGLVVKTEEDNRDWTDSWVVLVMM